MGVEFKWASYAPEVVEAVNGFSDGKKPDLVVLGGGAWDKLWRYETDNDKKALKSAVEDLAKGIKKLRKNVPVVWTTPTTINTAALSTPEKQERITEDEMKIIRDLYKSEGVLSASSFVIDGESFTSGRVLESFDGVHYPHNVYSAGAQILCNSMDWLLPEPNVGLRPPPKQPGEMAHTKLGLLLLCFAAAGIFLFDGFMGFSYLAAIFAPSVAPKGLYYEAFSTLHQDRHLPTLEMQNLPSSPVQKSGDGIEIENMGDECSPMGDGSDEIVSLIGKER